MLDEELILTWKVRLEMLLNAGGVACINTGLKVLQVLFLRRANRSKSIPSHIVAYMAGTIGDVVVRLPVLVALKKRYPNAAVQVLLAGNSVLKAGLFAHLPYVDQMENLSEAALSTIRCALFVNLSGSGQIGWLRYLLREMAYARRMGASFAVGFNVTTVGHYGWNLKSQHRFVENEHERWKRMARTFSTSVSGLREVLPTYIKIQRDVQQTLRLSNGERFMVLVPGASKAIKRWRPEYFARIANRFVERYGTRVIAIGTEDEADLVQKITALSKGCCENAAGKLDVWGVVELLRMASLCVTNDTGPMHIAVMLGIPTVSIFSSVVPTWWFPSGGKVRVLFSRHRCVHFVGPESWYETCLHDISVDCVWDAIQELLESLSAHTRRMAP